MEKVQSKALHQIMDTYVKACNTYCGESIIDEITETGKGMVEYGGEQEKDLDRLRALLEQVAQAEQTLKNRTEVLKMMREDKSYTDYLKRYNQLLQQVDGPQQMDYITKFNKDVNGARHDPIQEDIDMGDEDMVIAGASESLNCPILLKRLVNPYKNRSCGHVYSHVGVTKLIEQSHGQMQARCPVHGCDKFISKSTIEPDLTMVKKLQKADIMDGSKRTKGKKKNSLSVMM